MSTKIDLKKMKCVDCQNNFLYTDVCLSFLVDCVFVVFHKFDVLNGVIYVNGRPHIEHLKMYFAMMSLTYSLCRRLDVLAPEKPSPCSFNSLI